MNKLVDLTGQMFGRLTVVAHLGRMQNRKTRNHYWSAICECGSQVEVPGTAIRSGATKSCGCLQREKAKSAGDRTRTHGMTRTRTHISWTSMLQRCEYPKAKGYDRYGAAGVTVCEQWHLFENFFADMGERPPGTTLDRIDNSFGYEPGNCRWATSKEQARNQCTNRLIEFGGVTRCLAEWAETLGVNVNTLEARFRRGWGAEKALSSKVNQNKSRAKPRGQHESS